MEKRANVAVPVNRHAMITANQRNGRMTEEEAPKIYKREPVYRSIRTTSMKAVGTIRKKFGEVHEKVFPRKGAKLLQESMTEHTPVATVSKQSRSRLQGLRQVAENVINRRPMKPRKNRMEKAAYIGPATPDSPPLISPYGIGGTPSSERRLMNARQTKADAKRRIHELMSPKRLPFEKTHANRHMIKSPEINALNEQLRQLNTIADRMIGVRR